jgi:hypothetical protein
LAQALEKPGQKVKEEEQKYSNSSPLSHPSPVVFSSFGQILPSIEMDTGSIAPTNANTNTNNINLTNSISSYYKPQLVTTIALPKLGSTVSAATFIAFKTSVENKLLINDLTIYLEKDHGDICKSIVGIYKLADPTVVSNHVTK